MEKHSQKLPYATIPHTQIYYGYAIVAISFCLMIVSWGTFYSFGVFFDALHAEFGWNRARISGAFSLCSLCAGGLGIFTGKITDGLGPRLVTTLCGLLMGAGLLLMSGADSLLDVYFIYAVLIGFGMGGFWSPLVATVSRWFDANRGLMIGVVICGIGVGTMVMAPFASRCISSLGLKSTYLIFGFITLGVTVLLAQFLRKKPFTEDSKNLVDKNPFIKNSLSIRREFTYREVFRTYQFWMLMAIYFFFGLSLHTVLVHVVPRATDIGISPIKAASIISLGGGASLVGRIGIGGAGDRFGPKKCMLLVIGLMSISIFWLSSAKYLWMFQVFAIANGIGYGGLSALQGFITADLFGLRAAGVIVGNISFAFTFGGAIGPFLGGYIFDLVKSYTASFLACAIMMAISFVLGCFIAPVKKKGLMITRLTETSS